MAREISLYNLREDIKEQADVSGATNRYTATYLNRQINASRQTFAREISNAGAHHLLQPYSGTTGSGVTSPFQFYELDLSAADPNMVAIYGIDVTVSNVVRSLTRVGFEQRSEYGDAQHTGPPEAWAVYRTRVAAIFPAPDQAYAYTAWYLPSLDDLSADADVWDGVAGWEEWVKWDVVAAILARDNNQSGFQLASQERAKVAANVIKSANRVSRAGSATVARDSFGERIRVQRDLRDWRRDPFA